MTIAEFSADPTRRMAKLVVHGHADARRGGQDLVCAACSTLTYTLAQNLKIERSRGILKYEPRIKLKEGDAIITARASNKDGAYEEMCLHFLHTQVGFQLLAHNYPDNVTVSMFGED